MSRYPRKSLKYETLAARSLIAACILSLSTLAHATSPKPAATTTNIMGASASSSASAAQGIGQGGTGGSTTTTVKNERQAPGVGAPGLTSFGGCKGSVAGGVTVPGFGVSFGTTVTDEECQRLNSAAYLTSIGHGDAGLALVCANAGVRDAMASVGKACPGAPAAPPPAPVASASPERHPACSPSSWATQEWRAANCR